jgi:chromosome segregation ATPase
MAAELVYSFLTKLFQKSKSSVSLYIRCYNKFSNNIGAVEMLTISDMSLLVHSHISDEVVEKVIDARREDPDLTKSEVTRLIASLKDEIAGKDNSIEEATSQLTATVGRLDDAQKEIDRLSAELTNVRQEQSREKVKAQETQVSLASSGKQVATLQQTLANKEREVGQLTADIVKLKANPIKTEVPVEIVPRAYSDLEEAVSTKLAEHKAVSAQLEEAKAQLAALEGRAQEQRSTIEAGEVLEKRIRGLIDTFSTFVRDYHSAQLLATADGNPARFKPLFQAFSDLIGKFHVEVTAAAKA